ncbi:MAG: GGDEF domain-containing protein [Magnetococcus sp. YQC-9]
MDNRVIDHFSSCYASDSNQNLQRLAEIIAMEGDSIIHVFTTRLVADPINQPFLCQPGVGERLTGELRNLLRELFRPHSTEEVTHLVEQLHKVGDRHARLNIPLISIQLARTWLREEIGRAIIAHEPNRSRLNAMVILVGHLIDLGVAIINGAYIGGVLEDTRLSQSMKLQAAGLDMALESESLRSSLFDWHRRVLTLIFQNGLDTCQLPSIRSTDFGLWVHHKGDLLVESGSELEQLKNLVGSIDTAVLGLVQACRDEQTGDIQEFLADLETKVTTATKILSAIRAQTLAMEAGRDTLTKLFNRRFLRTVLQREANNSMRTGHRFAAILADLDHFKSVNDQYGHHSGDAVLNQMAEILMSSVRAGDFVFRYGGEEFLMVVNNVEASHACQVAEKVRRKVADSAFRIENDQEIHLTTSLGIAMHDGHPDYYPTLARADAALYQAKEAGRNQWQLADGACPPVRAEAVNWPRQDVQSTLLPQ